jgi:hypothetical protein
MHHLRNNENNFLNIYYRRNICERFFPISRLNLILLEVHWIVKPFLIKKKLILIFKLKSDISKVFRFGFLNGHPLTLPEAQKCQSIETEILTVNDQFLKSLKNYQHVNIPCS